MADPIMPEAQEVPQADPTQQAAPQQPAAVPVFNPSGELVTLPQNEVQDALSSGYQPANQDEIAKHKAEQQYGGAGQAIAAGLEGAARTATFGLSTGLEKAVGLANNKDIQGRRLAHEVASGLGEVGGLLIPGAPEAEALGAVGKAAAKFAGLGGKEASVISKIGSSAVNNAVQTAMVQGGDEISKMISGTPGVSAESAAANMGMAAILGGALGAGVGAVNPLWKATIGNKTHGLLKAISDRMGGIEGQAPDAVDAMAQKAGVTLDPVSKARMSADPTINQMAEDLYASTSGSRSAKQAQEASKLYQEQLSESAAQSFGKTGSEIPEKGNISKYETGKSIGSTLADEYEEQLAPTAKAYDEIRAKYGDIPLNPSKDSKTLDIAKQQDALGVQLRKATKASVDAQRVGNVEASIENAAKVQDLQKQMKDLSAAQNAPGTTDTIADRVANLAHTQGWVVSPSSDIMRNVNKILGEVPELKTVKDLGHYISAIGDNMQSDPMNGSLKRAGGMIKAVLRNEESNIVGRAVGSEEGAQALQKFEDARNAYHQQSVLKDAIDGSLHARGSTSGYAKSLRTMAQTDGETLLNRLASKNDSALLKTVQENFPKTAEQIRQYHIDSLLSASKDGDSLHVGKLFKNLDKLSPEIKAAIVSPEAAEKLAAIKHLFEASSGGAGNSVAKALDSAMSTIGGSAVGYATMLMGHNPGAALILGALTKLVSKEAPDAVRLGMLKFLSSSAPIESGGFKAMVDYIHQVSRGESLSANAVKNVFKAAAQVLPQGAIPSDRDRVKLDKTLMELKVSPEKLLGAGGSTSHYLPDHGQAIAQMSANATNYLNSLRPSTDRSQPLDNRTVPSAAQTAAYNRALDIAQQPLLVLSKAKTGTITPEDVTAIKTMYPNLYTRLSQKVMAQVVETTHKGDAIPYKTRLGLSLFLGQPLDSTMTPAGILGAQPQPQEAPQNPASAGKNKRNTSSLGKMNKMYETPGQAAESHKSKD